MQPIEQQAMKPETIEKVKQSSVVAVLVVDEEKHAVPLAKALLRGGVDTIELTLRTPAALPAAAAIKKEVPEITLGIGTVLTVDQVKAVTDLGVDFAVAPGCNPRILAEANKLGLSFAPGIMTPTDIEIALEYGCRLLKYFPAESSGGMGHLKNIVAPYQYLGLSFIPLGGVNLDNARAYLEADLIAAIGGSWLAKRPQIMAEDWEGIEKNARDIRTLIEEIR